VAAAESPTAGWRSTPLDLATDRCPASDPRRHRAGRRGGRVGLRRLAPVRDGSALSVPVLAGGRPRSAGCHRLQVAGAKVLGRLAAAEQHTVEPTGARRLVSLVVRRGSRRDSALCAKGVRAERVSRTRAWPARPRRRPNL